MNQKQIDAVMMYADRRAKRALETAAIRAWRMPSETASFNGALQISKEAADTLADLPSPSVEAINLMVAAMAIKNGAKCQNTVAALLAGADNADDSKFDLTAQRDFAGYTVRTYWDYVFRSSAYAMACEREYNCAKFFETRKVG